MGYEHREIAPGSIHHVWNRGLRRKEIYRGDADRHRFNTELRSASLITETIVLAYCQMGNHYHLLVASPTGRLPEMMQRFASRYARAYNAAHGYDGPLFRGRYQANRIDSDAQALATARYIDRNPLELGCRIDDYPWSSYPIHLGRRSSDWVSTDFILELAGGRAAYQRFVEAPLPSDRFAISDGVRSIASTATLAPDLAPALAVIDAHTQDAGSRRLRRSCAVLIAMDVLDADAARVAAELGIATTGALRTALSRARRRLATDDAFAALVRVCSAELASRDVTGVRGDYRQAM